MIKKKLKKIKNHLFILKNKSISNRRKVACLILDKNLNIISSGYNNNDFAFLKFECEDNSNTTYYSTNHAEENALRSLNYNCHYQKIYLFVSDFPCFNCSKQIVDFKCKYNIKKIDIIYFNNYHNMLSYFLLNNYNIKIKHFADIF